MISEKWYDHKRETVLENDEAKILWDFISQRDEVMEWSRPHIVVLYKKLCKCIMADIACLIDPGVKKKEQEKLDKNNDFKYEIGDCEIATMLR